MLQLDLFRDNVDEKTILLEEIKLLKESNEKVRRSLFARHGELAKNYLDLMNRMNVIERFICRG